MLRLTDSQGRRVYTAVANIQRITEADASSQWHGIRCLIRTLDGRTIECSDSVDDVARMIAAEAAAASRVDDSKESSEATAAKLQDALAVLGMVDKNNRIDEGEPGKAWSGRFVRDEVRRVLAGQPPATGG